jgi:hypothetical protein
MRVALANRDDLASGQESPELDLLCRPADLGDDRRGNRWNHTELQSRFVFSPRAPIVSVCGHQNG